MTVVPVNKPAQLSTSNFLSFEQMNFAVCFITIIFGVYSFYAAEFSTN
jgi:hypothetical protein